jgi:hypothetical protein
MVLIARVSGEIPRFARSFHAQRQARKKRFSLEDASCVKAWIRRFTVLIKDSTSDRLNRSVKS